MSDQSAGQQFNGTETVTGPVKTGQATLDLKAQARSLRKTQSTADIILETAPAKSINRMYIYVTILALSLVVLIIIFANPASRQVLGDRSGQVAAAFSPGASTTQTAAPPAGTSPALPGTRVEITEPPAPYGPVSIKNGIAEPAAPPAPAVRPVAAPPAAPARPVQTAATNPSRPRATASPQPVLKSVPVAAGPEKAAYQLLLTSKPFFSDMLAGKYSEYTYKEYTATPRENGATLFDFTFLKGTDGEPVHFLWEAHPGQATVRAIGLSTSRLDRQYANRPATDSL